VIVAGGIGYDPSRRAAPRPPTRGDLRAPFDPALTIAEQFLTGQVNNPPDDLPELGEAQHLGLREATLRLLPDGAMQVAGRTAMFGPPTAVRVVLLPRVSNGRLRFTVLEGRAGVPGLPANIADEVETIVNRQIRTRLARTTFRVIAIEPGAGTSQFRLKCGPGGRAGRV